MSIPKLIPREMANKVILSTAVAIATPARIFSSSIWPAKMMLTKKIEYKDIYVNMLAGASSPNFLMTLKKLASLSCPNTFIGWFGGDTRRKIWSS